MDYHIYTDGAYSQQSGNGAWAYIILTDTRYINSDSGKSKYIKAPAIAEDIAIGMACYYLLSFCSLKENDNVFIYTDSLVTLEFVNESLDSRPRTNNKLVLDAVKNIKKVNESCNLTISKVKAHKSKLSLNIVVDRFVKLALRS